MPPLTTPHLATIDQVYQKVLRECYRTWHAKDVVQRADHFYNFCITAHSLRDYFAAHKGWEQRCSESQPQRTEWNSMEVLQAVKDIANSVKHFRLTSAPKTKAMEETTGAAVDVYCEGDELIPVEVSIPDFVVTTTSGQEYHLWEMMSEVTDYWRRFLTEANICLADDPHYFSK